MIDLHTHILPNVDDGSFSFTESLKMLSIAGEIGTHTIVATPHCNIHGKYHTPPEKIKSLVNELQNRADTCDIDITVLPGMEIMASPHVPEKLKSGELMTLNNTVYPLVEFDFYTQKENIFFLMKKLIDFGYKPILAHPERYECFAHNPADVYELYKMGIVIQVNKGSVMGHFGKHVQNTADEFFRHNIVSVAASDAHGSFRRTPDISEFADMLDYRYGMGCAKLVLDTNPSKILNNEDIIKNDAIPFKI